MKKQPKSFNEAYAIARRNKEAEFVWKGNKYSSDLKIKQEVGKIKPIELPKSNLVSKAFNVIKKGASEAVKDSRSKTLGEKVMDFAAFSSPSTKILDIFTSLPINVQQMALKIAGLPTKMSEKDLNPKQKLALYSAIKEAKNRTGKKSGYIDYKDYGKDGAKVASGQAKDKVQKTFTDPSFQTATTLGRGFYKDKGDSVIYTDKYDFSKGAFENTQNPNAYQVVRKIMGKIENTNPTAQDLENMKIRIALSKKDMEKMSKQKG